MSIYALVAQPDRARRCGRRGRRFESFRERKTEECKSGLFGRFRKPSGP